MGKERKAAKSRATPARDKWLGRDSDQARRLRVIQALARKNTDAAFAKFLGITEPRLNNLFNGAPIGKEVAFLIRQKLPSLSLEYIWFGETARMSAQAVLELDEAGQRWKGTTPAR